MTRALFNVVYYDEKGYWNYARRDVSARTAVEEAMQLVTLALHPESHIDRVQITDADDFTNFLWERGKGIVYPQEEQVIG